jgi:hypothetical protein
VGTTIHLTVERESVHLFDKLTGSSLQARA